jgi:signal peptidase II
MQTPGRKGFAVTDRGGHLRLWLAVGIGLALDLATKYVGWSSLGGPVEQGGHPVTVLANWVTLVASQNYGIVFGFNFSDALGLGVVGARVLTVVLTLATVGLIFYVFAVSAAGQKWLHIWCGLVMAGALGNLYDRLVFGYVRDLIHVTAHAEIGGVNFQWPYVFNVADIYLVAGVGAVAIAFFLAARHDKSAKAA